MSIRHPKHQQGRKRERIKPVRTIPLETQPEQRKVDKILSRSKQVQEEKTKRADREKMIRNINENSREARAARREAYEAEFGPPGSDGHRHNYKNLVRVTDLGNRVVSCKCGDYTVLEGTGDAT